MFLTTDFVRRLGSSRFNYWFGYVANISLSAWLISQAWPGTQGPVMAWGAFVAYAALGLVIWTLAEYALHRYVYHEIPSFLSVGHGLHHDAPRELIGVPWWLTSAILVGVFYALAQLMAPAPTGVVMGFTWLGYIAYCLLHHGSHHWRFEVGYFRAMKRHHLLHHAFPEKNWGFTTALWDRVFGTYKAPRESRAKVASAHAGRSTPPSRTNAA